MELPPENEGGRPSLQQSTTNYDVPEIGVSLLATLKIS
jgi:hypothetical protein